MYKKLPINDRYSLNLDGSCKLDDVEIHPTNELTIEMAGEQKTFHVDWLKLLAHYEVDTNIIPYRVVYFEKCENRVIGLKCGYFMFYRRPVRVKDEFYSIPGFTRFAISKDGRVLSLRTSRILSESIGPYGYPCVHLYDPDKGNWRSVNVHLLLARTFISNNNPSAKCFVNHKNGIKTDYSLSNLEWVTSAGNQNHAVESGLRSDNVQCVVEDLKTGVTSVFRSMAELKRVTRTRKVVFFDQVTASGEITKGAIVASKYKVTPLGYATDWIVPNTCLQGPFEGRNVKANLTVEHASIKGMSRLTKVDESTIKNSILEGSTIVRSGWVFRLKTTGPWPECRESKHAPAVSIAVRNVETNEVKVYASKRKLTSEIGIDKRTLANRLETGKLYKQFSFSVYSPPSQ